MTEQKQIQKKIRFLLSSQTSKENLSFVILLMLMTVMSYVASEDQALRT